MLLAMPDSLLLKDIIASEQLVDLVDAWVVDSLVEKNRQRLKGFGGWIAQRTAARYWQQLDNVKQKYVGTNSRPYHIFNGVGDEVDINIFIMPHLPRYVDMVWAGFEEALKRPRSEEPFRFDEPANFPLPEKLKYKERGYITVECEVTPNQEFAGDLSESFLPVLDGTYALDTMPNFGTKHPSIGMTGAWCMDCNHNCRPEIHPIEWIWWLDLSKERPGSPSAKSWMVGLMVDASNRFNDWSPSPIAGEIVLPFLLPLDKQALTVQLDFIAGDPVWESDSLWDMGITGAIQSEDTAFVADLQGSPADFPRQVHVETTGGWVRDNVRYWVSGLEEVSGGYMGHVHIAAMTQTLLALRVTIDAKNPE